MSTIGWVILLVLLIPAIGVLVFVIVMASLVRIPSGSLGLVMVKGRATDTALLPGSHFVPALRRRLIEEYPSTELAYRAGGQDTIQDTKPDRGRVLDGSGPANRFRHLDQTGPSLSITLGDKAGATVSFTVRFQLQPEQLRVVHERFGPNGMFGIIRDDSSRAVQNTLAQPEFGVDSLFGEARTACQQALSDAVRERLAADGITMTAFVLGAVDLGRTGDVIAATTRARHELDCEQAEAATRLARALNDSDLEAKLGTISDLAWRYRETDLWRELVQRTDGLSVALRAGPGPTGMTAGITAQDDPAGAGQPLPEQPS